MNDLEKMHFFCDTWDGLYSFNDNTKHIIGINYPFSLIKKHGVLFNSEKSAELKSDEELLLRKAVTRIGGHSPSEPVLRWSVPVKVIFGDKSPKFKLYHGLFFKDEESSTELTWLTINDKMVDFFNRLRGTIPEGYVYYGIEIPMDIINKSILESGIDIKYDFPNTFTKPNATTIFIKSLKQLTKHYGQGK